MRLRVAVGRRPWVLDLLASMRALRSRRRSNNGLDRRWTSLASAPCAGANTDRAQALFCNPPPLVRRIQPFTLECPHGSVSLTLDTDSLNQSTG